MAERKSIWRASALAVVAAVTVVLPTANAAPGQLALASTADDGTKSNGSNYYVSVSEDGTHVAFSTTANNLDEADTDAYQDVYVKDLTTGEIHLASTFAPSAKNSYLGTGEVRLSADGSRVAFSTAHKDPAQGDTDPYPDIYVKDLTTGQLMLASSDSHGADLPGSAFSPTVSADGSRVAFVSAKQVYVKDLGTNQLLHASTADDGTPANAISSAPSLSADGSRVAFSTWAYNLDPADMNTNTDVYLKDLTTGAITLVSDFGPRHSREDNEQPSLSADGSRVAFYSYMAKMREGDADHHPDIYVKDMRTGELIVASTAGDGVKGNDDSLEPSLSADGTRVAFVSAATNLGDGDRDGDYDVYVKDMTNGGLSLASAGDAGTTSNGLSLSPSLSNDGTSVAFLSTATNLHPSDSDTVPDAYVKDVGNVPPGESPPTCRNSRATVYVSRGYVVGGPDAAQRYTGFLSGTKRPDVMVGTSHADFLFGGHADDLVCAKRGNDNLYGQRDNDRLFGGAGQDNVQGWAGRDLTSGQAGADTLKGGLEADRFVGGPGRDVAKDYNADEGDTLKSVP